MLARPSGELLVERERRRRARRVRREARPEEGELVPAVERVEVRQPARLLPQRHGDDLRAGEERPALVHRVPGLGHRDEPALADRDLREREDRLLRAERRDDLAVRVHVDAVPAPDPRRDGGAQLGQPGGARVGRELADPGGERLADERRRRLAWVADAEVDHVDPARPRVGAPLVEAGERVLLEPGEDRREVHERSVYQNASGRAVWSRSGPSTIRPMCDDEFETWLPRGPPTGAREARSRCTTCASTRRPAAAARAGRRGTSSRPVGEPRPARPPNGSCSGDHSADVASGATAIVR